MIRRPTVIIAFVTGLGISVVIFEGILRIIEISPLWQVLPVVERELGWPDQNTGYVLRPNRNQINIQEHRARVTTNSLATRNREITLEKPVDTYRIVVLGDSFTEAIQVSLSNNFVSVLENLLSQHQGSRVEVLNLGVTGSGPVQQLYHWKHYAQQFNPDLSLFVMDERYFRTEEMTNDSINPAYVRNSAGEFVVGDSYKSRRSQVYRDHWIGQLFFFLIDNSRIARATYLNLKFGGVFGVDPGAWYKFTKVNCSSLKSRTEQSLSFWRQESVSEFNAVFEHYLSDLTHQTNSQDSEIVVALYGMGIHPKSCLKNWPARSELNEAVKKKFNGAGFPLIDIDQDISLDAKNHGFGSNLFGFGRHLGQGHLNEYGHKIYASQLYRRICPMIRNQATCSTIPQGE